MRLKRRVLRRKLGKLYYKMPICIYKLTDSTNTRAKLLADGGFNGSAVFLADEQSNGRGRMDRRFISEKNKGLYLSILLSKDAARKSGIAITTYMAVIASRVIENLTPMSPQIKWVNDIYVGGKKLAGILTEGKTNPDTVELEYAICGIGVNILKQDFDTDVKRIATSIEDECGVRLDVNLLASEIITEFFSNLDLVGSEQISKEYKERSFLIGKSVDVIKLSETYTATVLDITDDCSLRVKREDGSVEMLSTGEVSIRAI